MRGGHGRKLLAGVAAWVVLTAAGTGCQSTAFRSLQGSWLPSSASPVTAKASPVVLGPPVATVPPAPHAGSNAGNATAWRPAQHTGPAPAAAASAWHLVQRDSTPPSQVIVASGWRTAPTVNDPHGRVIQADLAAIPPVGGPPVKAPETKDLAPGESTILPPPRPLPSEGGVPEAVAFAHGPLPHHDGAPNELAKVPLPPYVVEPPDILLIETTRALRDLQEIRGQHLVRPDGTISLGVYGSPRVAGMTLEQVRAVVAATIDARRGAEKARENPTKPEEIAVDVLAYNSKVYYIITDGGGYGQQVYRLPITGNETVLDAISLVNGLPPVASKKKIWIARRVPGHGGHYNNILPVDWKAVTEGGATATNYQILPGDRLFVESEKLIKIDSGLAKILSPIERVLGTTLLGSETYNSIANRGGTSTGR
jgi:polysaccharide export outer membrane protein